MNIEESLSANNGNHWSIKVKINDGTCAVVCDMDDQFLVQHLGVSAADTLVRFNKGGMVWEWLTLPVIEGLRVCCIVDSVVPMYR